MTKANWFSKVRDYLTQPAFGTSNKTPKRDSSNQKYRSSESTVDLPDGSRMVFSVSTNQPVGAPPAKEMIDRNPEPYLRMLRFLEEFVDKRVTKKPLPENLKDLVKQEEEPPLLIDTSTFPLAIKALGLLKKTALNEYDRDRDWKAPGLPISSAEVGVRYLRHTMWNSGIMMRYAKEHMNVLAPDRKTLAITTDLGRIDAIAEKLVQDCYAHGGQPSFKNISKQVAELEFHPFKEARLCFQLQWIVLSELTVKALRGILKDRSSWKEDYKKAPSKTLKRLEASIFLNILIRLCPWLNLRTWNVSSEQPMNGVASLRARLRVD